MSGSDLDAHRTARAPGGGTIDAHYRVVGARTVATRLGEQGALRLRQPRGADCQSILVNTAGGIVCGDHLSLGFTLGPHAAVTATSAAAEKIYRGDAGAGVSAVEARFTLAEASRLAWVPQETILFDRARLRRRFTADLAETATLVAAELLVFGRTAYGEHDIHGLLHDAWRVRRGGRLVFADETRLDGAIGRVLDRAAVAGGRPAVALLLAAGPDAPARLEATRAALATAGAAPGSPAGLIGGATLKDGIIVARILAPSAEALRAAVAATLPALGVSIPRVWR